jgi:hypothetical protein
MEWFDLKEALIGFVLVAATVALVSPSSNFTAC